MALTSRLARPLLASMFVHGGIDALREPAARAKAAGEVAPAIARTLGLPDDPEKLVKINAAVQIGAGLMLATGKLPRVAALALAASLVPTTIAEHRFWELEDPARRKQQQLHFVKNASMLGGLLLAAADTEGRPSLAWRGRRAARQTTERARELLPVAS